MQRHTKKIKKINQKNQVQPKLRWKKRDCKNQHAWPWEYRGSLNKSQVQPKLQRKQTIKTNKHLGHANTEEAETNQTKKKRSNQKTIEDEMKLRQGWLPQMFYILSISNGHKHSNFNVYFLLSDPLRLLFIIRSTTISVKILAGISPYVSFKIMAGVQIREESKAVINYPSYLVESRSNTRFLTSCQILFWKKLPGPTQHFQQSKTFSTVQCHITCL